MGLPKAGVELVADGLAAFTSDVAKGNQAVHGFGEAANKAAAGVRSFGDAADRAAKISSLTSKLKEQQSALGILQQELAKASQKYGEGSIQAQKKQLAIDKLTNAIGRTEAQIKTETAALNQEQRELAESQAAADKAAPAIKKSGDAAEKAGQDAKIGAGGFNAFGEIVIGAARRVGAALIDMGIRGAKAIAGFVTDSIGVAGNFEAGMNKFQAVAGKGVDTAGLSKFRDLFIQLGRELPVSTTEVEQAAIEMVSGGIDPAIVAGGALRSTLQFAAASGLSLADAAATSAKFLAGWTSSAATTEEKVAFLASSTDDLTKAAAASSTTAAELRLGLFNVQGAAQALHAPFQDVVATLAELAPAFESSAQAGTALNVFMTRLVPSTNPAIDKMNELGLMTSSTKKLMQFMSDQGIKPLGTDLDTLGNQFTEWASAQGMTQKQITKIWKSFDQSAFFDAQGNFAGMANAAQLLKDKLGGLSDEQKIEALHTLFGNDAMKVANLLMQDGAKGIDAMKAKMADANGVAATAALMQAGYNTALENAKGSVEALQITIGSYLLPVLTTFLNDYIAPGINSITAFADSMFKASDPVLFLTTAIDGVLPGFQSAFDWLGVQIPAAIAFVNTNWDALKGALIAVGAVLAGGLGIAAVASLIATLTNPITLIVAGVALLGAAWSSNWGDIQGKTAAVWGFLQPIFTEAQTWLAANLPVAVQTLSDLWTGTLQPALQTVGGFIQGTIMPILNTLATIALFELGVEVTALSALWTNVLQPALQIVGGFISDTIMPIMGALFGVAFAIAKKEVEALAGLWQKVLWPALQAVGGYIKDTMLPFLSDLGSKIGTYLGPILEKFTGWLSSVTGGVEGVSGAVKSVIGWLGDMADKISSIHLPDWLTPGSPTPWEIGLRGIGDALKTEVNPGVANLAKGIAGLGAAQPDPLVGIVAGFGGKEKDKGKPKAATPGVATPSPSKPIVAPIKDAIDQYIEKVVNAIGGAITREQAMISMGLSPQVAPPASAGQIAAGGGGGAYHVDNSRHLTMPVQTNMSPSAIQQSAAIALAVMP